MQFPSFTRSLLIRFKFETVTSGEFRDHFVSFFENMAAADSETAAAEVDATPKKSGKNGKKGGKGGSAGKAANNNNGAAKTETPAMAAVKAIKALDWNNLFFCKGMPTNVPSFANSLSAAAEDLAAKWITVAASHKTSAPPANTNADDIKVLCH